MWDVCTGGMDHMGCMYWEGGPCGMYVLGGWTMWDVWCDIVSSFVNSDNPPPIADFRKQAEFVFLFVIVGTN